MSKTLFFFFLYYCFYFLICHLSNILFFILQTVSNSGKALNQSPLASPIRALLRSAIHQNGSDPPPTKNSTSESNSVRCDVSKSQLSFGPPCTLAFDVASIQSLSEINTDVGRSRAFIRLCLQRRLLSSHLRTLLSDRLLLTRYYRKHAFLRSEDEREQFLTYLLTLSTVRLRSFSALYGNCSLRHRLFVHGSVPFAGQITVLLHSPNSPIQHCFGPPAQTQHTFHARSLVHPMCMWLRVDPQIKCFVHTVFLINEITGQSYK